MAAAAIGLLSIAGSLAVPKQGARTLPVAMLVLLTLLVAARPSSSSHLFAFIPSSTIPPHLIGVRPIYLEMIF